MAIAEPTVKAGWEVKTLGEVCEMIKRGIAPKYSDEGGLCVINQKCVRDHLIDFSLSRRHDFEKKKVPEERIVKIGDVLVNSTGVGTLGRVAQIREETEEAATVDTHVTIVRPIPGKFYLDFFGYMLVMIEEEIKTSGEGASGQTELARKTLSEKFHVKYPNSLPEQERIVGILDEAFEGIAAATAQAEKNLHNARELFQSVLQSTFSQKGNDWVEAELDEITESTQIGLVRNKKSQGEDLPYRYVKMNNIGNDNTYNETDMISVNADAVEVEKFSLRKGDLLFNTRNSHELVGKSCIYQSDSDSIALYNNNIMRIRFLENIKEEFAAFAFSSKQAVDQLDAMVSGTTNVAAIYYKSLRHLKIPVPPLPTQQAIVEKLDALSEETKRLEAIYERKKAALTELKQSLLQKAFAGEL